MSCFRGKDGGAEFMEKVLKGTQVGKKNGKCAKSKV